MLKYGSINLPNVILFSYAVHTGTYGSLKDQILINKYHNDIILTHNDINELCNAINKLYSDINKKHK